MPVTLPTLGAAFDLQALDVHRAWLIDSQRDLELQHFLRPEVLIGDWHDLAQRTARMLDGWNGRLGLHGPFIGFSIDTADPDIRDVVRRRLDQALDVAAVLKATQIVVHSPFRTWDHHNLDAMPNARASLIERVHACLGPAVARAQDLGVEFVIENIEDMDPMARVALARSFAGDTVRVSLDTGHANYAHHATGAPPVDFHIEAAGDLLTHVHLQDTDGYADRHWSPGMGNVLWPAVFDALRRLASQPRLILELADRRAVPAAAAWLEQQGLAH